MVYMHGARLHYRKTGAMAQPTQKYSIKARRDMNLFFVIVCDMSVAGVGIATVIADAISAGLVMMFLIRPVLPNRY